MQVELCRSYHFSAAHHLPHAPAGHKCRRLHGHSYRLDVAVRGKVEARTGWLMDYADIDRSVKPILAEIDHRTLNDVPGLENATSEVLAGWVWARLEDELEGLYRVSISETPGTVCHYYGDS